MGMRPGLNAATARQAEQIRLAPGSWSYCDLQIAEAIRERIDVLLSSLET